jgi:hypothetical protein
VLKLVRKALIVIFAFTPSIIRPGRGAIIEKKAFKVFIVSIVPEK